MKRTLMAGLVALLLTTNINAVTLEIGVNGLPRECNPLVAVNQTLFNKGRVKISGKVEKEKDKPLALQCGATVSLNEGYSISGSLKEGIDEKSDPFNPGYWLPSIVAMKSLNKIAFQAGLRANFSDEKLVQYSTTVGIGYKLGNLNANLGVVSPISDFKKSTIKLVLGYDLK